MSWYILLADGVLDGALRGAIIGGIAGALVGVVVVIARLFRKPENKKKKDEPPEFGQGN
jgi:hypothetical protein